MDTKLDRQTSIDALNALLRGELSAVETYEQLIRKTADDPIPELDDNRQSHARRAKALRDRITILDGVPDAGSGVWGAFAKLVAGGAELFGRAAAIGALEEGEDRGLADYHEALDRLDPESRLLVESELLPEQVMTHQIASDLVAGVIPGRSPSRGIRSPWLPLAVLVPLLASSACHGERRIALGEASEPAHAVILHQAAGGFPCRICAEHETDG